MKILRIVQAMRLASDVIASEREGFRELPVCRLVVTAQLRELGRRAWAESPVRDVGVFVWENEEVSRLYGLVVYGEE